MIQCTSSLEQRMCDAVSFCWNVFAIKVGSGLIPINKEASMQLQYAYLLKQYIPLITFDPDDEFSIELETSVEVDGAWREIDIVFNGKCPSDNFSIAIEMKCYKEKASSGKPRGATDIFMKDVYFDLFLLERYVHYKHVDKGVALVMNDLERLVNPKSRSAKCWTYDISDHAVITPSQFNTPIGGKDVNFSLRNSYRFVWQLHGKKQWFVELKALEVQVV
ncbi:hypothetical protein [Vibrio parahaemolyticus]|uniref:hypothetical protein n=2 Tax=Vibrionaceae TaxID=641 RepID=UPI0010D66519|nr:hypothetical protein [Vibrio parahaemolyticus]MBE4480665.1 hypothetical protein [Vibrio parahaemolyticus]MCS0093994.1 hypothetical protein [Vibrio parahaemolyticus]TBT37176.1 hypothetical protein D5E79_25665 [Vibrio parahaemolyticus]TNZ79438.1 hypothetical protein CGK39_24165 [Vibrio parahaemolyticus]TOZ88742.1 hypothetical protein DXE04_24965 [Vibrio parahaemolyticus]